MEEYKLIQSGVNEIEGWGGKKKPRQPIEAAEGVDTTEFHRGTSNYGEPPGGVSLTRVSVGDLISEGRISGLAKGYYTYQGTAGNTGWTIVTWNEYDNAPNTTVPWLRSVYWNQVPVVDASNQFNFQEVTVQFTPGTPNGSTTDQISTEVAKVRPIGERLRYGSEFAKTYRILNKNVKAVDVNVRFSTLSFTSLSKDTMGDITDTEVVYYISYRPLFSTESNAITTKYIEPYEGYVKVVGKITQGYIRETRINLYQSNQNFSRDTDFLGWEIKIERITPDSKVSNVQNQTTVDSLVEIYGDIFSYPNSAITYSRFSAEFFSQIPSRTYDTYGLRVLIPSNYDPIKRSYSPNLGDDWDGTFKTDANGDLVKEWTDNPAWCYFDLLTNRRYGLGKYITGSDLSVDKWTLYNIGRYCDVLVSDGYGKLEPRMSCNAVINTRDEAFQVVNSMASIFRGMIYYGAGTVYTVQDAPKQSYVSFTNANVENGDFTYVTSSKRNRFTVAIVRYNDKRNFYKPALEYVEDIDAIRRYGVREVEIFGFGCTSRGQAVRLGRWVLLTQSSEVESITFTAGLEGSLLRPGDVVEISDRYKRGTRYGGRCYQIHTPSAITLDSQLPDLVSNNLYYFNLVTPTWSYDPSVTSDLIASDATGIRKSHIQTQTFLSNQASTLLGSDDVYRTRIDFTNSFDINNYSLSGQLIWTVESSGTADMGAYNLIDKYKVVRVEEKEQNKYLIAGLEYNVNKYNQIESGLNFGSQTILDTAPPGPSDLKLNLYSQSDNGNVKRIDYRFTPPSTTNISKYLVYVKIDSVLSDSDVIGNTYLVAVLPSNKTDGSHIPQTNGRYNFRVYSASLNNTKSTTYATNDILVTNVNPLADIIISSLRLETEDYQEFTAFPLSDLTNSPGTRLDDTYTSADPRFLWNAGFQSNTVPNYNLTGLGYRVTIREPSTTNTPSRTIYYEPDIQLTGRFEGLSYAFKFDENRAIPLVPGISAGGPYRNYDVVVEAVDTHTKTSAAGGQYEIGGVSTDTTFENSYSYDVLGVTNPPIDDFLLTDPTNNVVSRYNTEQWITSDGAIKLWVKDNIPKDWAGGVAYVWTGFTPFTQNEAYKKFDSTFSAPITVDKNIIRIPFIGSGENGLITIPTGITGYLSSYMSASILDRFDGAKYEDGILTDSQLTMSNVVKIQKRLGFNDKLLYKAWIETKVDYNNQSIQTDWTNYSIGFKDITFESYNDVLEFNSTKYKWNFNFEVPMPNTNYVVIAPNSGIIGGTETNVRKDSQIIKFTDKVQLVRFKGIQFLGVLYNGN